MLGKKKSSKHSARNPHLSDQPNQPVFSYRAVRSGADRQLERGSKSDRDVTRLKRKLKHLPYALSLIAVGAALLYNLTLVPNAQIIVSGDQAMLRPAQAYQQAINNRLRSSLTNRTKVTINTNHLSDAIRREFPEIEIINISLPLLRHQPIIEIRLAMPAALLVTPDSAYVLNDSGRVLFDKNNTKLDFDASKMPVINDPSGYRISLGTVALTSQQISYANELLAHAKARQLQTESMTLAAGGEELHVRFQTAAYLTKFSFGANGRQSFGAFVAAKERVDHDKLPVAEYIDVRIPERAYVK